MPQKFTKDPDSKLNYMINWASWLDTDTIDSSEWTVTTGLTKVSDSNTTTTATVILSGGTAGTVYEAVNTINTAGSLIEPRTIYINIDDR